MADVAGSWVLELQIPDHHIRHVRMAEEQLGPALDVSFVLKTAPEVKYHGTLQRVAMTTTNDPQGDAFIQAVVALTPDAVPPLRAGAAVVARIHCGRAPVGYVWLHDLIDTVRTWLFFW